MREYIFRGKAVITEEKLDELGIPHKNGWLFGDYSCGYILGPVVECTEEYIAHEWWCGVDDDTVGQYTGRKDKKGQEIYEGDILHREVAFPGKSGDYYYVVKPIDDYLEKGETYGIFSVHLWESECEVIGNIHDNPELVVEQ